jgi:hypothetical protein
VNNPIGDQAVKRRKLSILLFTIGTALGMILIGASVYADFESTLFDATYVADSSIRPIRCPIFLSATEEGRVSAVISNSNERPQELVVRAHITRGHLILMREVQDRIPLEAGESKQMFWKVTAQDAAYGHLILVKIIVLDDAANPSHKGSCGIIVLDLPGNIHGWQLFWLIFLISLSGLLSGMSIWWKYGRSYTGRRLEATRSILGLGVIITLGLIFIVIGFWEFAAVAFYIGLLSIGVIVPHFLITR